ncbi:MAG: hypothetical protein AAF735_04635 [Myxococcota bacterium]
MTNNATAVLNCSGFAPGVTLTLYANDLCADELWSGAAEAVSSIELADDGSADGKIEFHARVFYSDEEATDCVDLQLGYLLDTQPPRVELVGQQGDVASVAESVNLIVGMSEPGELQLLTDSVQLTGDTAGCRLSTQLLADDRASISISNCSVASGSIDVSLGSGFGVDRAGNASGSILSLATVSVSNPDIEELVAGVSLARRRVALELGDLVVVRLEFAKAAEKSFRLPYQAYGPAADLAGAIIDQDDLLVKMGATSVELRVHYPAVVVGEPLETFTLVFDESEPTRALLDIALHNGVPAKYDQVAAGWFHTCGIRSGSLYCWGRNERGQLGVSPDVGSIAVPQRVGTRTDWSFVAAGSEHTCAIASDQLWCWGDGSYGQLGTSESGAFFRHTPERVGQRAGWSSVSTYSETTCGISDGELLCWGANDSGQVGVGVVDDPIRSPNRVGNEDDWVQISVGTRHTCGIRSGELYCWGSAASGRVGHGEQGGELRLPVRIGDSNGWERVTAGAAHTCGIQEGMLFCWGSDYFDELGNGPGRNTELAPTLIDSGPGWTDVRAGEDHTCALRDSQLFCWGDDGLNQLGNGPASDEKVSVPTVVGRGGDWRSISVSDRHSCGLDGETLYCWGAPMRLGHGDSELVASDTLMRIGLSSSWDSVSRGSRYSCGIRAGALFCWGRNRFGEVGVDPALSELVTVPTRVGTSADWSLVASGVLHSCGIREGELYCWGSDEGGQLGDGAGEAESTFAPVRVGNDSSWEMVSAASSHTCAIRDGALYCWGAGPALGLQTDVPLEIPTLVDSGPSWTHVRVGEQMSCGIRSGQLWCWGRNGDDTLGLGDLDHSEVVIEPTRVGELDTWSAIAVGIKHSCGIAGGKAFCWGSNRDRELGVESDSDTISVPTPVDEVVSWTHIEVSSFATCGLRDSQLFCWGAPMGWGLAFDLESIVRPTLFDEREWDLLSFAYGGILTLKDGRLFGAGENDYGETTMGFQPSYPF